MKKIPAFLLAILMIALLAACGSGSNTTAETQKPKKTHDPSVFIYGDADGDGYLSILDVTRIQRHLAGLMPQVAEKDMKKAIVSGNAELSVIDATLIQQRLVNIIKSFPVEDPNFVPQSTVSETLTAETQVPTETQAQEDEEPDAYDDGYDDGYDEGYDDGYDDSFDDGYDDEYESDNEYYGEYDDSGDE